MNTLGNARADWLKLTAVFSGLALVGAILFFSPALSIPAFLSLTLSMILGPMIRALERRDFPRSTAVGLIFILFFSSMGTMGFIATRSLVSQWDSFQQHVPTYFQEGSAKLRNHEEKLKASFPLLKSVKITDTLVHWVEDTSSWFFRNAPNWMGQLLNVLILVPIFTFYLLSSGPAIRHRLYLLIPNRFFESVFMVLWRISASISDYLRAKLIEATLVGLLTAGGLAAVGAPYALVLGGIAGLTNILPYVGPVLGAAPGLLIAGFDPSHRILLWPILGVYLTVTLVDNFLIFPVIVAKLVDLPPIVLIVVVILGQEYYGVIGMLISIPVATSLKIVLQEVLALAYPEITFRSIERRHAA